MRKMEVKGEYRVFSCIWTKVTLLHSIVKIIKDSVHILTMNSLQFIGYCSTEEKQTEDFYKRAFLVQTAL